MIECTVVIDDCAEPPRPNVRNIRLTPTTYGPRNFGFNFDALVVGLREPLDDQQLDWLWIAASMYAADVACERGIDLDWDRRIELHVPVSDPGHWAQYTVRLEDAFGRLTYDQLDLSFHERRTPIAAPRPRRRPFGAIGAVALLSGGIDSFVGSVSVLGDEPDTFFVSHSAASVARAAQRALEPALRQKSSTAQFGAFTAQRRSGFGPREGSERSRTILFLACAGLVAAAAGASDIFLNENGVMAIHLPLTEARVGSLSTRTAAPSFVDEFGDLMSDVLGTTLTVRNRLIRLTKPEVAALAIELGCASSIKTTISCWSIGHTRQHCGYCAPCMMRRIACELHAVPDASYQYDVFGDPAVSATRPFARDNLVQFVQAVSAIDSATDEDLELDFPELLNGGREIAPAEARDVHRRWAHQALGYLKAQPVSAALL